MIDARDLDTPLSPLRGRTVVVTGATGYIGGRLVPRLLDRGARVRCLVRDPARLLGRAWSDRVEVVEGDVLEPASLPSALHGAHTAYYLIHSMQGGTDFAERDRLAARNFGRACRDAGVEHIISLGGLGSENTDVSDHLRSRHETGHVLRESGVVVTELQAGVVVGSGSLGFEMVRYLTERIPVLICPRWVFTRTQPIGVRDLLDHLIAVGERDHVRGKVIPVGGANSVSSSARCPTSCRSTTRPP